MSLQILEISKKFKKKQNLQDFSNNAYEWQYSENVRFLMFSAYEIVKKEFKNLQSKGCSKRFFTIFAIFWEIWSFNL